MKAAELMRRAGWRRLAFAGFCLAMVLAGLIFLSATGDPGPARNKAQAAQQELLGEFRRALPPALLLLGLLAAASPWLIGRGALRPLAFPREADDGDQSEADQGLRRFWIGAVLATVVAATLWGQRLGASLWTDEVTSLRLYSVGRWKHDGEGNGKLLKPSWADTLFRYETPNNHSLYNAVARVVHGGLVGVNDDDFSRPYFIEWVLRLPAFLAALASLSLIGYLALRLGSLLAAWLAMGWMVFHPWLLEFSTSARGYSFAMLFLALAAVAAVQIMTRGGGWRWWVLYGLGQVLAFASIVTVVHSLLVLNIAVFVALVGRRGDQSGARREHLGAFFATNLVASALALLSFLPKLTQFRAYTGGENFRTDMPWSWMGDCLSNLLVGQPYLSWDDENPWSVATEQWPVVLLLAGLLVAAALAGAGVWRCWRGGLFAGVLASLILLPPLTTYLQGKAMAFYLFPWYSAFHLPLLLALLAIGAAAILNRAFATRARWWAMAGGGAFLLVIGLATQAPRKAYLSVPVEPQRESAAVIRESLNPYAPGQDAIITTSLVTANHAYDPWNMRVRNADELWVQIAAAEATDKPLFCETAWVERVRKAYPDCAALLLYSGGFELVSKLDGLQPQNTRYVFRYRAGSLRVQAAEKFGGVDGP